MTTEIKYPAGTTKEEWDKYYADLKKHEERVKNEKPEMENYWSEGQYAKDMAEWHRMKVMDAPNVPGAYRANND